MSSEIRRTWRVAELEAQVAALEIALVRRSEELRELQKRLCRRDLLEVQRCADGLPPLGRDDGGVGLMRWRETTELRKLDVAEGLEALWSRVAAETADAETDDGEGDLVEPAP